MQGSGVGGAAFVTKVKEVFVLSPVIWGCTAAPALASYEQTITHHIHYIYHHSHPPTTHPRAALPRACSP
jgi:hypothetical protein